jgi:hypothetical protein
VLDGAKRQVNVNGLNSIPEFDKPVDSKIKMSGK